MKDVLTLILFGCIPVFSLLSIRYAILSAIWLKRRCLYCGHRGDDLCEFRGQPTIRWGEDGKDHPMFVGHKGPFVVCSSCLEAELRLFQQVEAVD